MLYAILLQCYVLYVLVQLNIIHIHSISPVNEVVYLSEKHIVSLHACAVAKIQQLYPKDGRAYRGFQWPNM